MSAVAERPTPTPTDRHADRLWDDLAMYTSEWTRTERVEWLRDTFLVGMSDQDCVQFWRQLRYRAEVALEAIGWEHAESACQHRYRDGSCVECGD